MNPLIIIIPVATIVLTISAFIIIRKTKKKLKNKKVFFTGPTQAGKTTLIKQLLDEPLDEDYVPTYEKDNSKHYKSEKYDFQITDMGGGKEFLDAFSFGKLIREHDVIIFVFDVDKYLSNKKYREEEVNPRMDFLWSMYSTLLKTKVLLLVGSHLDKIDNLNTVRDRIDDALEKKEYRNLLVHYPLCLCNLTQKGYVIKVYEILNKELDKLNKEN